MEVTVSHGSGVRFTIRARSHSVLCDQPIENGGDDSGMTPPELLLAALGSCAAYYAAEYLRTRDLAPGGVEVSVSAEKLQTPARLGNFRVHVVSPVVLTGEQRQAMMRCVHHCLVHNTLRNPPEIEIELETREGVAAHG